MLGGGVEAAAEEDAEDEDAEGEVGTTEMAKMWSVFHLAGGGRVMEETS